MWQKTKNTVLSYLRNGDSCNTHSEIITHSGNAQ